MRQMVHDCHLLERCRDGYPLLLGVHYMDAANGEGAGGAEGRQQGEGAEGAEGAKGARRAPGNGDAQRDRLLPGACRGRPPARPGVDPRRVDPAPRAPRGTSWSRW